MGRALKLSQEGYSCVERLYLGNEERLIFVKALVSLIHYSRTASLCLEGYRYQQNNKHCSDVTTASKNITGSLNLEMFSAFREHSFTRIQQFTNCMGSSFKKLLQIWQQRLIFPLKFVNADLSMSCTFYP